jgi:Pyruvate-formate lyase
MSFFFLPRMTRPAFTAGLWQSEIDVRDFIQRNYTPYECEK